MHSLGRDEASFPAPRINSVAHMRLNLARSKTTTKKLILPSTPPLPPRPKPYPTKPTKKKKGGAPASPRCGCPGSGSAPEAAPPSKACRSRRLETGQTKLPGWCVAGLISLLHWFSACFIRLLHLCCCCCCCFFFPRIWAWLTHGTEKRMVGGRVPTFSPGRSLGLKNPNFLKPNKTVRMLQYWLSVRLSLKPSHPMATFGARCDGLGPSLVHWVQETGHSTGKYPNFPGKYWFAVVSLGGSGLG